MLIPASTFYGNPFSIVLDSLQPVACGATAKIFAGKIVDNKQPLLVAVKVFGNMLDDQHHELLLRELQAAQRVSMRHPLILAFIGSASFGLQTSIVSLYMRNGNLLGYLRAQQDRADKRKLIMQVAEAVDYPHTVEGLVHGDLKCANVLVSDFGDALLADFGLSTFVEKAQTSVTTVLSVRQLYTVRFAAPELLLDAAGSPSRLRSKTCKSDVYAFGMLVLEAITESPPWAELNEFAVMHRVCNGAQPLRPPNTGNRCTTFSRAWWKICQSCWSLSPEDRPTMQSVLMKLRDSSVTPRPARMGTKKDQEPDPRIMIDQSCTIS